MLIANYNHMLDMLEMLVLLDMLDLLEVLDLLEILALLETHVVLEFLDVLEILVLLDMLDLLRPNLSFRACAFWQNCFRKSEKHLISNIFCSFYFAIRRNE